MKGTACLEHKTTKYLRNVLIIPRNQKRTFPTQTALLTALLISLLPAYLPHLHPITPTQVSTPLAYQPK